MGYEHLVLGIILAVLVISGCGQQTLDENQTNDNFSEKNESFIGNQTNESAIECAKEGGQFSGVFKNDYPEHCCGNLTEFASGMDTRISVADKCYQTGMLSGLPVGTCINCGNGVCEDIETPCSCPSDCIGKSKSEYLSVQEFCDNAPESYCEHADSNLNDNLVDLCKSC
ncbi:MAG: hypothetical protein WC475_04265 [Candidatus Paceibacterota bacterium]